jgi:hypothetical protein
MTDKQTPPDWVLVEAAKRCGWNFVLVTLERLHREDVPFRALCDMIERYEQPPVDRKLLCAREAMARGYERQPQGSWQEKAKKIRAGDYDAALFLQDYVCAIELWEEGFGK